MPRSMSLKLELLKSSELSEIEEEEYPFDDVSTRGAIVTMMYYYNFDRPLVL